MRPVKRSYVVLWTTLSVFLLLTLSTTPVMAAQDAIVCPADRINSNLNICSTSDVQLAAASVGNVDVGLTCMAGEDVEVAIAGTVNLRKGDRFDIGVWISSDGKPIDVRGGNDLLDPGNVPDEGGAQTCEVMPLPSLGIAADSTVSPNIIDSFDDLATPQDCYDTAAVNNGDEASDVQLTSNSDSIINGMVDVDSDGVINGTDNSGSFVIIGFHVFAGLLDLDDDGTGGENNGNDDGVWSGYAVENGIIDVDGDGIYGANDGTDDSTQSFNDSVTMKCIAGPTGKVALESLVSWHVPTNAGDICSATDPDSYGPFSSAKCSVTSSEIDLEIVGRVTIIKSAPAATNNEEFEFSYTNSAPTFADTSNLIPDISADNPFYLMDTEDDVIWAVIGNRDGINGPFIPASVVITETSLPNDWQLESISCVLAGGGTPVNTTVDIDTHTATVELSYNDGDPLNSQDDIVCTFTNTFHGLQTCNINIVSGVIETSIAAYEACDLLMINAFIAEDGASVMLSSGQNITLGPDILIEQGATLDVTVCGQSLCTISALPMPYGCHSCVDQICTIDSSCCDTAFDLACLDMVDTVCGLVCE